MPCSYEVSAIGKFALLSYLSEVLFHGSDGYHQQFPHETRNNSEEVIEESETETVVHYESPH